MFINAEPRIVSNDFEAFVPFHRVESLHQRLVEMTNNEVNAWSIYRPVASTADKWDQHLDDFDNENFPVQSSSSGGYFQGTSSAFPRQPVDFSKTSSYTDVHQTQYQSRKKSAVSGEPYKDLSTDMNCVQQQSPMLGHDYPQWSIGRGRGSFAEFSKIRDALKDFPNQSSIDAGGTGYGPTSSAQVLQPTYLEEAPSLNSSFNIDKTSPNTVYSSYSPMAVSSDPLSLFTAQDNAYASSTKAGWWPQGSHDNRGQLHTPFSFPLYDGLPKDQPEQQQQQFCNLWNTGDQEINNWTATALASNTISPKALTLNVPPAPSSSSSGSSQGVMVGLSGSGAAVSSRENSSENSGPEVLAVAEPPHHHQRQRQILPDAVPVSRRIIPILPSNDFSSSRNSKKRSMKVSKPGNSARRKARPAPISIPTSSRRTSWRTELAQLRPPAPPPKKIISKEVTPPQKTWNNTPQAAATAQATHHRNAKDDFLVRSKLAGMSYKDIRRQGKFTEAESTLRGRFRTLTKQKAARVRKPEWDDNDIRLLKKAVRKLSHGNPTKNKVPWKQVAEYISNNGGSYHFGNATCRKRWDELQRISEQ